MSSFEFNIYNRYESRNVLLQMLTCKHDKRAFLSRTTYQKNNKRTNLYIFIDVNSTSFFLNLCGMHTYIEPFRSNLS